MALYSVWDWNRNSYRVYETRKPASVGDDPIAPKPRGTSVIGANPDTDVKPLPSGARFVEYSHIPRGEIRRASRGMGDTGDDAGTPSQTRWTTFALGAVAGAAVLWWWQRRSR